MIGRELITWEPPGFVGDFSEYVHRDDGVVGYRYCLSKGWLVVLLRMIYPNYRIVISKYSPVFYDDAWCFNHPVDAALALYLWDPATMPEPEGWIRHINSGRRRTYDEEGRIVKEWVNP